MAPSWTRLIRFVAEEDGHIHLGQVDEDILDVGLAAFEGVPISAKLIEGSLYDGVVSDTTMTVKQLLPPISIDQGKIIRCLGLNYRDHAKEANMPIPDEPVLFFKPPHALMGPWPEKIRIPKFVQDGSSDYEAELSLIISKTGKNISEEDAFDHVLGYTCGNDISARTEQFKNSQWSFSKGLDASAPIGPVLVSQRAIGDPHSLSIRAIYNGTVVQDSNTSQMIFSIPKIISFLSQGTTLEQGTVIMTGTPPGIGCMRDPKICLCDGDEIRVQIENIGTLINAVYYEK
ncbi:fumarylacetoacetate hydrolase domain-containing protein 2A [Trichoderma gamsii]|uniref:Fumarylacetoacetate hydrolase domain-containing protein 2A n=1 Tax=Trichoderma gamsii TaxID=398673 RepID=A0A2P4ZX36_9HYPO|nr:fumarylacetoacetate hydrolase domain-containing protein 2A [Trichoderma gamsii]PON28862.1 fumarylacetoacetate hydrolase domain-containing protein 2A [Trichoderma gamsii]